MRLTTSNFQLSGHFFYSCLFLLLFDKQAVTKVICESWLLESDFLSACDFIFATPSHCKLCLIILLLTSDYSSLGKRCINRRQMYEEVFKPPKNNRIIFEKQAKWLIQVKLSCFSKCDTKVERILWAYFLIHWQLACYETLSISYQEMKRFAQHPSFSSIL